MTDSKNLFAETLNLPQTDFPMRAGLPTAEPVWLQKWEQGGLYQQVRALRQKEGAPKFILHCGPPYANGNFHAGHVVPCSLKDIVVRSKSMAGFDAPFVPGWDCHGLPIEWKVEEQVRKEGKTKEQVSRAELRQKCRDYAAQWVATQKEEWKRLGAMGDWDNPYLTMGFKNEAGIVRELGRIAANGHLYKGFRPVMWSPVEETALAEAEVEYDPEHKSTAVYVKYPVVGRAGEFVVIWTTTPWTLPANKGVAYGAEIHYVLIQPTRVAENSLAQTNESYWVAQNLLDDFCQKVGITAYQNLTPSKAEQESVQGQWLFDNYVDTLCHPFYKQSSYLRAGHHVTTESGTGFVHLAPAHGADDFDIGKMWGWDLASSVDSRGHFMDFIPELPATKVPLAGVFYDSGQKKILAELAENGNLLHRSTLTHSYPISWRSKKPLITRTTSQWYLDLDGTRGNKNVREKALDFIHGRQGETAVRWVPAFGENRLGSMVKNRGDWCLSRQRVWGVPITILEHEKSGEFYADPDVFNHVATLVEKHGIDIWDTAPIQDLVPAGWLEKKGLKAEDLTKVTDILDVWFDSGSSYAHVMDGDARFARADGKRAADLYLEGSDQHRGWFQSSLLASIAARGVAPYEQVLTHGFVVDKDGKKMSKSIGNGMDAMELGQKYGMDIARLWIASSDYSDDIRLGDEIIKNVSDSYRRFRNTFRFLLGNLHGFTAQDVMSVDKLPELERYVLHRLATVANAARVDYDNYQFHKVFQGLFGFCSVELSGFYFDVRKDVLYCDGTKSPQRLATQTVLHHILHVLSTFLAPIIPFTTEEVWQAWVGRPALGSDQFPVGELKESIHLHTFAPVPKNWLNEPLGETWAQVMEWRHHINKAVEEKRAAGVVGSNVEVAVRFAPPEALKNIPWTDVLIVSEAHVEAGEAAGTLAIQVEKSALPKCPRCWQHKADVGQSAQHPELCGRCAQAVSEEA